MTFLFKSTKNLLIDRHEKITNLFLDGIISYKDFELYEIKYNEIKELFTINLN